MYPLVFCFYLRSRSIGQLISDRCRAEHGPFFFGYTRRICEACFSFDPSPSLTSFSFLFFPKFCSLQKDKKTKTKQEDDVVMTAGAARTRANTPTYTHTRDNVGNHDSNPEPAQPHWNKESLNRNKKKNGQRKKGRKKERKHYESNVEKFCWRYLCGNWNSSEHSLRYNDSIGLSTR